jgi:hypothetical protein
LKGWEKADSRCREAHQYERHEKGVFPSHQIADSPEEERPERPHHEADREGGEVCDQCQRIVARRIEERRDCDCQRTEDVEIIPLYHRADGRGRDYFPDAIFFRCALERARLTNRYG